MQSPPCAGGSPWPWPKASSDVRAAQLTSADLRTIPARDAVVLRPIVRSLGCTSVAAARRAHKNSNRFDRVWHRARLTMHAHCDLCAECARVKLQGLLAAVLRDRPGSRSPHGSAGLDLVHRR